MAVQVQDSIPAQARRSVQSIIEGAKGKPVEAFRTVFDAKLLEVEQVCLETIRTAYSSSPKLDALLKSQGELSESDTRLRATIGLLERLEPDFVSRSFGVSNGEPFCENCGVEEIDRETRQLNRWRGVLGKDSKESEVAAEAIATVSQKIEELKTEIETLNRDIEELGLDVSPSKPLSGFAAKFMALVSPTSTDIAQDAGSTEDPQGLVSRSVEIASGLGEVIGRVDVDRISEKEQTREFKHLKLQEKEALLIDLRAKSSALAEHISNISECILQKVDLVSNLPGTLLQSARTELEEVAGKLADMSAEFDAENERLCKLAEACVREVITFFGTSGQQGAKRLDRMKDFTV